MLLFAILLAASGKFSNEQNQVPEAKSKGKIEYESGAEPRYGALAVGGMKVSAEDWVMGK